MNDKISEHAAAYDFVKLGEGLADTLMRAAEEQMVKAQTMMDQTKALVEIITNQVMAQAKSSEDMNARFKQVGSLMLDAHRILNETGDYLSTADRSAAPLPHLDKLRALDALRHNRLDATDSDEIPFNLTTNKPIHPKHAPYFAQPVREFPRPLAAGERHANPDDQGENRHVSRDPRDDPRGDDSR